jgi:hypothetical protein
MKTKDVLNEPIVSLRHCEVKDVSAYLCNVSMGSSAAKIVHMDKSINILSDRHQYF